MLLHPLKSLVFTTPASKHPIFSNPNVNSTKASMRGKTYDFPQKASTRQAVKSSIVTLTLTRSDTNLAFIGVAVTIRNRSFGPKMRDSHKL
jgi:hypothetical protein